MRNDNTLDRRSYLKAVGAGVTATGLTGYVGRGAGTAQPDEVLIGGNHPLSGSLSRAGKAMANAGRLAVKHVNEGVVPGFEDGGIPSLGGAQLTFEAKDNEGKQELGGQIEQELLDAGARAIVGCYSSPVTIAATQVAERSQVPHVVDVSVADRVLQGNNARYAWRVGPNARRFTRNYATFMPEIARNNDQSMDTASVVYIDTAFGQSMHNHLKNYLPENGVEVVLSEAYSFGQSNMSTEATKVKETDADAFVFVGYGSGGIQMMNSFQNVNYRPPLMTGTATPTFTSTEVISEIGEYANNGFGNNYDYNYGLDWTDTIYSDYEEEFGNPLEVIHTSMTYTTVVTVANAIKQAGSAEREAINNALGNITVEEHPASMGPITFTETHENENALTPMLQVQDLEANVVWPEQYQQAKPQF